MLPERWASSETRVPNPDGQEGYYDTRCDVKKMYAFGERTHEKSAPPPPPSHRTWGEAPVSPVPELPGPRVIRFLRRGRGPVGLRGRAERGPEAGDPSERHPVGPQHSKCTHSPVRLSLKEAIVSHSFVERIFSFA
jgi:hypothetical protein